MASSGIVETEKLMAAGRGCAGEELRNWVEREKNYLREERAQAREAEKEEQQARERACQAEAIRLDKEREILE